MAAAVDLMEAIDQYRLAQKKFVKRNPGPFKEILLCARRDHHGKMVRFRKKMGRPS
jgi:hypothetical protein